MRLVKSFFLRLIFIGHIFFLLLSACKDHATDPAPEVVPVTYSGDPFARLTPSVFDATAPSDLLLEVGNSQLPQIPILKKGNLSIPLYDDQTHGDKKANDGIFSCKIQPVAVPALLATDVYRAHIGIIEFKDGGFLNIFGQVWNGEIPQEQIVHVSDDVQKVPYLVNIRSSYPSLSSITSYTKEFYKYFPDDFDFINLIFENVNQNRHHHIVRNEVEGIGLGKQNESAAYGSQGKLLGINVYPNAYSFDGANVGYVHEIGHQWINYLQIPSLLQGSPHWPFSDVAKGMMGYSGPAGQGSLFEFDFIKQTENTWLLQRDNKPIKFNDLELYLMGLIPAMEVSNHFVFINQNQSPKDGGLFNGPVINVSISDIISKHGERVPGVLDSKKIYKMATIIVTDRLLDQKEMSFYNYFSKRAELRKETPVHEGNTYYVSNPFYVATGGRGELVSVME